MLMAAAVADYRPAEPIDGKRPKDGARWRSSSSRPVDVAKALGARKARARCSSRSAPSTAPTGSSASAAMLDDKNVDLVVYNDVGRADIGFDSADNEVVLVAATASGTCRRRRSR